MDWGGPGFVLTIIAISTIGWVLNNWIRARHGYALEDELFGKTEKGDTVEGKELRNTNQQLLETMEKMQDRMVVLERIVTDKGYTVAEEIEALRDTPPARTTAQSNDSGVPLEINSKEKV